MERGWLLMDDNATPHIARMVTAWKEENGVRSLPWPSRSPDMNPIENLWGHLKRKVEQHNPQTINQLAAFIREEWDQIGAIQCQRLVNSLPQRLAALTAAHGWYTRY